MPEHVFPFIIFECEYLQHHVALNGHTEIYRCTIKLRGEGCLLQAAADLSYNLVYGAAGFGADG